MKKLAIIICTVFLCSLGARAQADIESTTFLKKGMEVPAFTVKMLDGTTLNSADLNRKVVMVNFWATWCPPCRKEFARLQKDVVDRFKGENFVLLPISIDDNAEAVAEFMQKNGYTFPVAVDTGKDVYGLFAGKYVPRNFILGPDGRVAFQTVGYTPEEFDALVKDIEALLK